MPLRKINVDPPTRWKVPFGLEAVVASARLMGPDSRAISIILIFVFSYTPSDN